MAITIKEPALRSKDFFVGIDFGTTNSVVGVFESGKVKLLSGDSDPKKEDVLLPSVVARVNGDFVVGKKAADLSASVLSVKRLLGKDLKSLSSIYPMLQISHRSNICLQIDGKSVNVVEIASQIFKALKSRSENYLKSDVKNAVVTVPAYFDDLSRSAIKNAASIAGFKKVRLLSEPTAAALFYGVDNKKSSGRYVVYDIGGGTFDVSVLDFHEGIFKVVTTDGDDFLGGDDFDRLLFDHIKKEYKIAELSAIEANMLMRVCKKLKEGLFCDKNALSRSEYSAKISGTEYNFCIDLSIFNGLISHLVDKTIKILVDALKKSGTNAESVDGVLLVGGSTRVDLIKQRLSQIFGQSKILSDINPDTIVAKGATLYSSFISGANPDKVLLLDVLPLSLGIETFGGATEVIIEKDSHIPISHSQVFTNFADFQTAFKIHVVQGEREFAKDNRSLAKFELQNIPSLPAGKARIELTFTIDESGILNVTAKELTSGVVQKVHVNPSYGLSQDAIDKIILQSIENLESDAKEKSLLEARNYAHKILSIVQKAIDSHEEIMLKKEKIEISDKLKMLKQVMECQDCVKINNAVESLELVAKDFLQRRLGLLLKKMNLEIPV